MKIKTTLTQIKTPNGNFTVSGVFFIDGDLEVDTSGTLAVIRDRRTKIQYITNSASSGINAVMTAAADTGGNYVFP